MVKKADEQKAKQQTLGSKEVAALFGLDPKYLRQILRASGKFNDAKHTRYEWAKDDPFLKKTLPELIEKYKSGKKEKTAKLPKKKAKKAAKGAPPSTESPKPAAKKSAKKKADPKPAADVTDAVAESESEIEVI